MRLIRDWVISKNTPLALRVFWYGNSLKEEVINKRFRIKFKTFDLKDRGFIKEIRKCDYKIPNPAGTACWQYVEKEGEYFIYTTIKI